MIEEGMIVKGPFWSEPIEIRKTENFGDNIQIIGSTIYSNKLYERLLDKEDLKSIMVDDFAIDFSEPASEVFLALEAQRYKFASMFDPFLAMSTSKIDPLPFQLDAVYLHALKQPRMRFMIADDPGAGKTIMAGLIIKELKMRGIARRILIVSPGHLKAQWQRELREKFQESFQMVDRSYINNHDLNPWEVENQYITSIDFAKQKDIRKMLSSVEWDLVVVDEAHKMSAWSTGKSVKKTLNYKLGEVLSKTSEHMLFLTATPHKGNPENYRLLLDLLIPGFFADPAMVSEARRNGDNPLFIRRIKEDLRGFDGKPIFTKRFTKTVKFDLVGEEIELYNELSRYVQSLYRKLLSNSKNRNGTFAFALLLLQRRMASSIYALLRSLERKKAKIEEIIDDPTLLNELRLNQRSIEDIDEESEEDRWEKERELEASTLANTIEELKFEISNIERLIGVAESILDSGNETKLAKLKEVMESLGDEKILIFTEAKDTAYYLIEKIKSWGYSVNTITGDMSMDERIEAEKVFEKETQVMVATEAAGEGINLQFCHLMINYDIPWNPNRLEQRMGRIHRYKQQKDVHIFNFVAENTREGAVLATILDKLNEIRNAIGTDKVFDVIGDVFQGKDLYNLISDAVSGERDVNEIQRDLDIDIDGEYKEKLKKEVLDQGLVDNIDYSSIRDMSERTKESRLIPEYLEEFFKKAYLKAGGRFYLRKDDLISILSIPSDIKRIAKDDKFERTYGKLSKSYSKITFNMNHSSKDKNIDFVSFGHPLLEALIKWVEDTYSNKMRKGCTFIDNSGNYDGNFWFFEGTIKDGKDEIVGKKLFAIYDDGNNLKEVNPSVLWDFEPLDTPEVFIGDLDIKKAKIFIISSIKKYLDELKDERERQGAIKQKYGVKSLEQLIAELNADLSDLYMRAFIENVDLVIYNKEVKKKDYEITINKLKDEIIKEKSLTLSMPRMLGVIKVKSSEYTFNEKNGIEKVLEYEKNEGRIPIDLSRDILGYDIKSEGEDSDRYIIFKNSGGRDKISLTLNEFLIAKRFRDQLWLYILVDNSVNYELYSIQDPLIHLDKSEYDYNLEIHPEKWKIGEKTIINK